GTRPSPTGGKGSAAEPVVEAAGGDRADPRPDARRTEDARRKDQPDDGADQPAAGQTLPGGEIALFIVCHVAGEILRDQRGTVEFDLVLLLHAGKRLDRRL